MAFNIKTIGNRMNELTLPQLHLFIHSFSTRVEDE